MVVVFFGDWGVFLLVMAFKEVMPTSPPELAHSAVTQEERRKYGRTDFLVSNFVFINF